MPQEHHSINITLSDHREYGVRYAYPARKVVVVR